VLLNQEIHQKAGLLKRLSFLIVEDEGAIRENLEFFLKRRVKALYSAADGNEGLESFIQHRPDIVLTDINMPVMNGLDMAEAIRAISPDTPIVVVTAYNDHEFFIRSIELGVDRYVLKPIETEQLLKSLIEVAEKMLAKRDLEVMRKGLEDSMRLQTVAQFAKGISHNFNNILVGIMGYASLMRVKLTTEETVPKEELLRYIDTIENSTDRASKLIGHLSVFSKRIQLRKERLLLNDSIGYVLERLVHPAVNLSLINIELTDLPIMVEVDKEGLLEVLTSMLVNAFEASSEGGIVTIKTSVEENMAVISVIDNGCGMDEETQRRAFEPFFTTKGLAEHLGLGLSTANNIVKEHGGFIKIESQIGKGTEFRVYLPGIQG
jgi:signal transduction histidine kinase